MATNYEWLLHMDGEERQAWFDAEHVDAQSKAHSTTGNLTEQSESLSDDVDSREKLEAPNQQISQSDAPKSEKTAENATAKDDIRNFDDSREKLEADVYKSAEDMERFSHGERFINTNLILRWLDRQAAITRKTEQAAWVQQANGLIHEANARADELQAKVDELAELNEYHALQYDLAYEDAERLQAQVDNLTDELAKRDKGIERLKRQRDTARAKIDELHAECDTCCYKTDYIEMDRLTAERDALADDLLTCNRERERLRRALGIAIDHAHEIMQLVNIDGEVA